MAYPWPPPAWGELSNEEADDYLGTMACPVQLIKRGSLLLVVLMGLRIMLFYFQQLQGLLSVPLSAGKAGVLQPLSSWRVSHYLLVGDDIGTVLEQFTFTQHFYMEVNQGEANFLDVRGVIAD